MKFERMAAVASRAANAAYRSLGGPKAFTWLEAFEPVGDAGFVGLADWVAGHPHPTGRLLYEHHTSAAAVPFDDTPVCLQVACEAFVAIVQSQLVRVTQAVLDEQRARASSARVVSMLTRAPLEVM